MFAIIGADYLLRKFIDGVFRIGFLVSNKL
jgi:hypothetical protein